MVGPTFFRVRGEFSVIQVVKGPKSASAFKIVFELNFRPREFSLNLESFINLERGLHLISFVSTMPIPKVISPKP